MLYDKRWDHIKTRIEPWQLLLLTAADLIEKRGWIQGEFRSDDGRYCAMGAIQEIDCPSQEKWIAMARVTQTLRMDLVAWNDHRSRTKEQVVTKLREVALDRNVCW